MNLRRPLVMAALSGGVDSSVAAALLQERGFDVTGIHIKMWSDPDIPCNFKEDRMDAVRVAARLGIPFETWDLTQEYKQAVVEYMIREYAAGRTPNPDVMCNREIKFGVFLRRALQAGADFVATGHYARVVPSESLSGGAPRHFTAAARSLAPAARSLRVSAVSPPEAETKQTALPIAANSKMPRPAASLYRLFKAIDENKDQSYFLWTLTQEQLRHCLFPIGEYAKPEVREMARKFGLPTAEKKDSQGICFIGEIDIREFLKKRIPTERGAVLTTSGRRVGEHEGVEFYTIGQRHGIGAGGGGIPYYVTRKDFETNTLTVAEGPYDEKLFSRELVAGDIHWISGVAPALSFRCEARIRYRQPLQEARIMNYELGIRGGVFSSSTIIPNSRFLIQFDSPQRAITPGQSIVFYCGEEMIGGGIIGE